ncbi:hypothetical protein OG203_31900 [Nocardia sp. NBC_01499]|uniref:hypothetical protein n=1 Tax=Nocardia sp. NBC_01499 TaxID=2903597 RepID=UPI0038650CA6
MSDPEVVLRIDAPLDDHSIAAVVVALLCARDPATATVLRPVQWRPVSYPNPMSWRDGAQHGAPPGSR